MKFKTLLFCKWCSNICKKTNVYSVHEANKNSDINECVEDDFKVILYKKRWFMLFLFGLFSFSNSGQSIQYTVISNILTRYYNVSSLTITFTGLICSLAPVIFFIPGSILIKLLNLRGCVIMAITLTTVGAWIKCGVNPDTIGFIFLGQFISAIGQIYTITLPYQLALNWFSITENNLAASLINLGGSFSYSLLFYVIPIVVKNESYLMNIRNELFTLEFGIALFCTVILLLITLFFQEQPPTPPSKSRLKQLQVGHIFSLSNYWKLIRRCFTNVWYILLSVNMGLFAGSINSFTYMLNPILEPNIENAEKYTGNIGCLMNLCAAVITILFCILMDITSEVKKLHATLIFLGVVGYILFLFSVQFKTIWAIYLSAMIIGAFGFASVLTGYAVSAEIMYPDIEISSHFLTMTTELCSSMIIPSSNLILIDYGNLACIIFLITCSIISFIAIMLIPDFRKRQNAQITD